MMSSNMQDISQFTQSDFSLLSVDIIQGLRYDQDENDSSVEQEQNGQKSIESIRIPFNKIEFLQQPVPIKNQIQATLKKENDKFYFSIFDLKLMNAAKQGLFQKQIRIESESSVLLGKIKIRENGKLFIFSDGGMSPKKCTNSEYFRKYLGSISKSNECKFHMPKINQVNQQMYKYSPLSFKNNKDIIQQNNQFFDFYNLFKFQKQEIWTIIYKKEITSEKFLIKIQKQNEEQYEIFYTFPLNHVQAFQICLSILCFKM